jgi:hypothetical protein
MTEEPVPCGTCRARIRFIRGPRGKQIPVQRVRTLYTVETLLDGTEELVKLGEMREQRQGGIWVSHFETCPDAQRWSTKTGQR